MYIKPLFSNWKFIYAFFFQVKTHSINVNSNLNDDHRMKTIESEADDLNHDHHLPPQALFHMHHQRFMVADIKAEPRMTD